MIIKRELPVATTIAGTAIKNAKIYLVKKKKKKK
jgi:hypothetical protein